MALTKKEKGTIIEQFHRSELDTGSPEVQVALISTRIKQLTEHFREHKQDNHSRRGLFKLISQRKKLLNFLKKTDIEKYTKTISALNLRK